MEILALTVLGIAGWRIRLECDNTAISEAIATCYRAFVVSDNAIDDVWVTVSVAADIPTSAWPAKPVVRQGEVCLFDVPDAYGRIDLKRWQASFVLKDGGSLGAFEHLLETLCAYLAVHRGGLLFHCAGLLKNGQAHLFAGRGGSGKSTVISLLSRALALNDDMVVLRPAAGVWWAFGTPFWNAETIRRDGQVASGPVAGIYSLVQDRGVYLESLPAVVATSELVANCPIVNTDVLELPALIDRCRSLAGIVSVQRLHFRKDPGFWALL